MRMKKLTLDINERQEQEDYQGTHVSLFSYVALESAISLCDQQFGISLCFVWFSGLLLASAIFFVCLALA